MWLKFWLALTQFIIQWLLQNFAYDIAVVVYVKICSNLEWIKNKTIPITFELQVKKYVKIPPVSF